MNNNCVGGSFHALLPYVQSSSEYFKLQSKSRVSQTTQTRVDPYPKIPQNTNTCPHQRLQEDDTEASLKLYEEQKEVKFKPTKPLKAPSPPRSIKTSVVNLIVDETTGATTLSNTSNTSNTSSKTANTLSNTSNTSSNSLDSSVNTSPRRSQRLRLKSNSTPQSSVTPRPRYGNGKHLK
jgi:hypothetical protein